MADFKPKVISSAGHDKLLDDGDNLVLVNAPAADSHGTNKKYVDDSDTALETTLQANINAEEAARIEADNQLQSNIDAEADTRGDADTDLQNQIDAITGGDTPTSNIYVKRSGDNMTGNLTFDTNKIALNASGSAEFAGRVNVMNFDEGNDGYGITLDKSVIIKRPSSELHTGHYFIRCGGGDMSDISNWRVWIRADGSATFAGHLEAARIDGGSY